jgi:hypothetical protein
VKRTALVIALAALWAPGAAAAPVQQTDERAGVRAVLSYDCADGSPCRDFSLSITRNGVQALSERITPARPPTGREGIEVGRPEGTKPLLVRDLDRNGEQEVVVDLYTGGAHCCYYSLVYTYSPSTARYQRLRHDWGDVTYILEDLGRDNVYEFVGSDLRFAYLFTSFTDSRFPVQIWRYASPRLQNVTRRFPAEIRKDVRRLRRGLRTFREERFDVRGMLAALQADYYLLGRGSAARGWRSLRRMARRGQIRKAKGSPGPTGRRYIRSLHRYLKRLDYAR